MDHSKPLQTARSSWRNHQVPAYFIKYVVTKLHRPTQILSLSPLSNGPFKQPPSTFHLLHGRVSVTCRFWKDQQASVFFINATILWQSYITMPKFISLAPPLTTIHSKHPLPLLHRLVSVSAWTILYSQSLLIFLDFVSFERSRCVLVLVWWASWFRLYS